MTRIVCFDVQQHNQVSPSVGRQAAALGIYLETCATQRGGIVGP